MFAGCDRAGRMVEGGHPGFGVDGALSKPMLGVFLEGGVAD